MIALYRLSVVTPVGARKPVTEWSDDMGAVLKAILKFEDVLDSLKVEAIVGQMQMSDVTEELLEEVREENK